MLNDVKGFLIRNRLIYISWCVVVIFSSLAGIMIGAGGSYGFMYSFAILALPVLVALVKNKPEVIALLLLVLSFGLIPFLPIDFIKFSELLLLAGFCLIGCLFVPFERDAFSLLSPYKIGLILFFVSWLIALFLGLYNGYQFCISDAKRYLGLLSLSIFSLAEYKKQGISLKLIFIVGTLAAALMILQLTTGWHVFAGPKGFWETGLSKGFENVARASAEGGNYIVVFMFFYFSVRAFFGEGIQEKLTSILISCFYLFGLIATYSRGIWAGVFIGYIIVILISGIRKSISVLVIFMLVMTLVSTAVYIAKPEIMEATIARAFSVTDEGGKGTSVGARLDENIQAITALKDNWLLGMGHGGEYKKYLNRWDVGFVNQVTFIHNSYLWVAIKLGVIGIVSWALILSSLIAQAWCSISKKSSDEDKIISASVLATIIVYLVNGMTSPVWAQFSDLVALAILLVTVSSLNKVRSLNKSKNIVPSTTWSL
ncbi:O-antigen ligase family protein [Aeromonas allosaccharophila]